MFSRKTKKLILKSTVLLSSVVGSAYVEGLTCESAVLADTTYSTSADLNLRKGPGTEYDSVLVIPSASKIDVKEFISGKNWAKIQYKEFSGYVSTDYITKTSSAVKEEASDTMVTTDRVNFRKSADYSTNIVSVLDKGVTLKVTGSSGNFYKVVFRNETGYVSKNYMAKTSAAAQPAAKVEETKVTNTVNTMITADYINLRSGADTSSTILATFSPGVKVKVNGSTNGWVKVSVNGMEGYMSAQYLKADNTSTKAPVAEKKEDKTTSTSKMITTDYVNLRENAGTSSAILTTVSQGTTVEATEKRSDGWIKVKVNGLIGYMSGNYLKDVSTQTPAKPVVSKESTETMVTNDYLNLRQGPSTGTSILLTVNSGTSVTVNEKRADGWYKVTVNGKTGYMKAEYLSKQASSSTPAPTVNVKIATVTKDSYLKAGPNNDFSNLGYLTVGTELTVLDDSGYFVKVSYAGKTGYILDKYIEVKTVAKVNTPTPAPTPAPSNNSSKVMYTTDYLNLRKGPGTEHDSLGVIPVMEKLTVLAETNGWSKVTYAGKTGYVSNTYLSATASGGNTVSSSSLSGKITNMYDTAVMLSGKEAVSNDIDFSGVSSNYGNENINVSGSIRMSGVKAVYVYVNGFLQGKASYNGSSYSYTLKNNITRPGVNPITIKAVTSNGDFVSTKNVTINKTPVVVIDPGHGASDPGAVGTLNGGSVNEKDVTIKISKKLKSDLESLGFKVILTRDGDDEITLKERAALANSYNADFFISVHNNAALNKSANGAWTGIPSYKYNPDSEGSYTESALIAKYLQKAYEDSGLYSRTPTQDIEYTGYTYSVLRNTTMKSVLTEVGFITNEDDAAKLVTSSFQDTVASNMAKAIYRFFFSKN